MISRNRNDFYLPGFLLLLRFLLFLTYLRKNKHFVPRFKSRFFFLFSLF